MPLQDQDKFQLLLVELKILQDLIARYDQNGMAIKSICLTTWSALVALTVINRLPLVLLISVPMIFGFSLVEFTYRRFQLRFIRRATELERTLAAEDLAGYEYSIDRTASTRRLVSEARIVLRQPHFVIFYLFLASLSLVAYLYLASLWSI